MKYKRENKLLREGNIVTRIENFLLGNLESLSVELDDAKSIFTSEKNVSSTEITISANNLVASRQVL
jgi:hypothetical protein